MTSFFPSWCPVRPPRTTGGARSRRASSNASPSQGAIPSPLCSLFQEGRNCTRHAVLHVTDVKPRSSAFENIPLEQNPFELRLYVHSCGVLYSCAGCSPFAPVTSARSRQIDSIGRVLHRRGECVTLLPPVVSGISSATRRPQALVSLESHEQSSLVPEWNFLVLSLGASRTTQIMIIL